MEAELLEISQHMGRFAPFDGLSEELLDEVAGQVQVSYFKAGSTILELDAVHQEFCYIRSGAVEVTRATVSSTTCWARAISLATSACCATVVCASRPGRSKTA